MSLKKKLCQTLLLSTFILAGCQSTQLKPSTKTTQQQDNQFSIQGKIGVRTPEQSGSAFFTWIQNNQHFNIELTGALGIGRTQIEGQTGQVTLNNNKTGQITATTPEELLQKATGWQAPITHLTQWVQAKPATTQAIIQKDEQNRIIHIEEDQWIANLSYNENQDLPNKLILNNQQNRITMVIQNR